MTTNNGFLHKLMFLPFLTAQKPLHFKKKKKKIQDAEEKNLAAK